MCVAPVETPAASPREALAPASSQECGSPGPLPRTPDGSSQGAIAASQPGAQPETPDFEATKSSAEQQPAQQPLEHPATPSSSSSTTGSSRPHHAGCALSLHTPGAMPPHLAGCPAVYLARSATGSSSSNALTTEEGLASQVSATLLPDGPSLSSLHQLLQLVVAPWLAAYQPGSGLSSQPSTGRQQRPARTNIHSAGRAVSGSNGASQGDAVSAANVPEATLPAAAEMLAATHKLAGLVAAASKHLRSEVAVRLPAGVDLADIEVAAASEEAVLACEQCVEEWVLLTTAALQREAAAKPEGRGPLAELESWRARAEAYGGLLEQLSVPAVQAVADILQRGSTDTVLAASFRAQLSELGRLALDARDNARFLATLERHFQALADGSLAAVADAVQPMLNALRMVGCKDTVPHAEQMMAWLVACLDSSECLSFLLSSSCCWI